MQKKTRFFFLNDHARFLGINIIANRGTGKSRLIGRIMLPQDAYRNIPSIVIDPIGQTLDNFIGKLAELPRALQEQIWPRVRYIDMSGKDGVTPFPVYYRLGNESLYEVSQRLIDTIAHSDSALELAPIHGMNSVRDVATHSGMILTACGFQLSELNHLLTYPEQWETRFQELEKNPELTQAVAFFRDYRKWPKALRITHTQSLRIKANTLTIDPATRAMFNAPKPQIDLAEVIRKGQIVLFDFSGVTDLDRRRFMLIWVLSWVMSHIKARGPGADKSPLSLVIDEFSLLTDTENTGFNQELSELVNVYSRSHRLWLTIASQSIAQYNEGIQSTLASLGTQILGGIGDMPSALLLAEWFAKLDPMAVKYYHPIFGPSIHFGNYVSPPSILTYKPEYQDLKEQIHVIAQKLRSLPRFSFLVRPAINEGTVADRLYPITIANMDKDMWPNMELVEKAKAILRRRDGLPIGPILAEIAARLPQPLIEHKSLGTLKPYAKKRSYLPPTDSDEDVS